MSLDDFDEKVYPYRGAVDPDSDRGCVLVAGAFLDELLFEALKAHFVACKASERLLARGSAPLGSFSAKIDSSEALGIINRGMAADLHLIRRIRNEFAHSHEEVTFDAPPIRDRCRDLRHVALREYGPREAFLDSASAIVVALREVIARRTTLGPPPPGPLADGWRTCDSWTRSTSFFREFFDSAPGSEPEPLKTLLSRLRSRS